MKIIFICTRSLTFNTFLKSQANFLKKKGYDVKVACSDTENLDFISKNNYKINFPTEVKNFFSIKRYFEVFFQIRSLIKKNKSAIFYTHTPVASHFLRLFSLFNYIKIIYFVHGFRFTSKTGYIKSAFFKIIEKLFSFKTSIYITINNEDYLYSKENFNKNSLIYKINGVGLKFIKKYKKNNNRDKKIKKILVIAAYKKEKGYFEILKVAQMIKKFRIYIDCYGFGNFKKFHQIKKKNNISNISFKKFDKNLEDKIKNYSLLLHLSKREGLPVSIMQSLYNGLPVICYNIRGNNDLIKNGYNGFFVNSYHDVINRIIYLNLEKNFFKKMKLNAYNSIRRGFSQKEINQKIFKIITHCSKYCNDPKIR